MPICVDHCNSASTSRFYASKFQSSIENREDDNNHGTDDFPVDSKKSM